MTSEDMSLPDEMGRLEIEPIPSNKGVKEDNPFSSPSQKKYNAYKTIPNYKCACNAQKRKNLAISKKKPSKLLKDPVLRLSNSYNRSSSKCEYQSHICQSLKESNSDNLYLYTLVHNCNQLSISPEKKISSTRKIETKDSPEWWKGKLSEASQEASLERTSSSCSQQALNPPCDVTIDELASYFETFVHIPKKMSSMAEMMYI